MTRYAAIATLLLATGAARRRDRLHCNGILRSNGTCIGSESNVNSLGNHEPIYGDSYYLKLDPFEYHCPDQDRCRYELEDDHDQENR
jgi:hypothetical protein